MPDRHPISTPDPTPGETPLGPQPTPGMPDRSQEKPPVPPIKKPEDSKNPNDPTLLPMGHPPGIA